MDFDEAVLCAAPEYASPDSESFFYDFNQPTNEFLFTQGTRVNSYTLVSLLHKGNGCIEVWRARSDDGCDVALKFYDQSDKSTRYMDRELLVLTRVGHHPRMTRFLETFTDERTNAVCIAMQWGGESLEQLFSTTSYADIALLQYVCDSASALDHLHRQGFVHCDVKPGNVLVCDDRATLCDFNLSMPIVEAREHARKHSFGTPGFMSPEHCGMFNFSEKSDVYSLGLVAYNGYTGVPYASSRSTYDLFDPFRIFALPQTQFFPNAPRRCNRRDSSFAQRMGEFALRTGIVLGKGWGVQKTLRDIIMSSLQKDPALRPTCAQILDMVDDNNINGLVL